MPGGSQIAPSRNVDLPNLLTALMAVLQTYLARNERLPLMWPTVCGRRELSALIRQMGAEVIVAKWVRCEGPGRTYCS
jgi:hypothetical protein